MITRISPHARLYARAAMLAAGATLFAMPAEAQQSPSPAAPAADPASAASDPGTQTTAAEPAADDQADEIVVRGRFTDTGATSATKLPIPVLDTPFSVDAYNGNFLKAIDTQNVSDLYRYMTGIQRAGNTGYDITFRGFKTSGNDRNAILTDGLPGLSVRFGSPPTVGTDHIELVKGATSVLYGQAQPGGFINIISKKPLFHAFNEVELRGTKGIGDFDRQLGGTLSFDSTGPLDSGNHLAYRIVGEVGSTNGFRINSYEHPIYIAPSLALRLGDRTEVTVQGEFRRVKTHYDTYLVAPNRDASLIAAIDTSYQEPNDYLLERGLIGNIFLKHDFSSKVKLNIGYRYVDHYDTQHNFDVVGFKTTAPLTTITRRARGQINKRTYSFVDGNISAKIDTFGIHHTLLVGAGGGQETASLDRTQFYNCLAPACTSLDLNILHPLLGVAPALSSFPLDNSATQANLTWRFTSQNSLGAYASDLMEFAPWLKVMVGGRYAKERQTIEDLRKPAGVTHKRDKKTLPLAGLIIQPTQGISLYGSYSTSYVPQAAASQDVFGLNPFKPTFAESYETGIKTDLLRHRLSLTAAYFDIRKKDVLNTFTCPTLAQLNAGIANGTYILPGNAPRDAAGNLIPASGTCSSQIGAERSKGFEIELNASPLPGWTITGGYAHTKARITQSNLAYQVGSRETNSPDNALNFWTRYDFEHGALANFGIGLGVSYIGKRTGLLPTAAVDARPENGTLPLKAYTTVDLGIYYKPTDNLDFTLKVTNLFDERFLESAGFTADIQLVPGTPRYATLTGRFRF
ncbi:MAG: Iron complex outerrane receptor protein [Alphaproteobacteria bacterium]|nr:Iron complex outerrane receptor protein [Alphaproteobacteria bacterium]